MSLLSDWFRLNVDWHESEWLAALPWGVRAIWPLILGHVKANGRGGVCREPITSRFCAQYDIPLEAYNALRNAAVTDGALRVADGDWVVSNWEDYQKEDPTNAERQRRHRERKKARTGSNDAETKAPQGQQEAVTRYVTDVTPTSPHLTSPHTTPPNDTLAPPKTNRFIQPTQDEVKAYMTERNWLDPCGQSFRFISHYTSNGWKVGKTAMKDWKSCVHTWESPEKLRGTSKEIVIPDAWKD
jgi:hypothetical protein